MRYSEHVSMVKRIQSDLELGDLTRTLMNGLRHVDESDEETLIRVVEEYKQAKYFGKEIPEGVKKDGKAS